MFEKQCRICKRWFELHCTAEQIDKWQGGMGIQRAMPNVPKEERELLISGTCSDCFDKVTGARQKEGSFTK